MSTQRKYVWGMILLALIVCFCGPAFAEKNWAVSVYWARLTGGTIEETLLFDTFFENSQLLDVALSRKIYKIQAFIDFELEGQVVKHFQDQDHWEFNALIVARWLFFPWDKYLDTSFAVGEGLSYATKNSEIEGKRHDKTSKLLNYLMFEFDFTLPRLPDWSLFTRIHHRSGVFGLFDGMRGASDAWGVGLRYRF